MDSPTLCPNLSQKKAQFPFDGAKPFVGRCEPGRLGSRTEAAGWSQVSAERGSRAQSEVRGDWFQGGLRASEALGRNLDFLSSIVISSQAFEQRSDINGLMF